jgi:P27 family predicted phage terminase small subunit
MAPPRLPTKLKLIRGETRPSRLNHREPQPRAGLPRLPAGMTDRAKQVWRRVVRDYGPTGVLTSVDADVLRIYCEAVARYEQAGALFDASGPVIRATGNGARRSELVKNPLAQIVRDQADLVRAMARELGLTPSARAGLRASEAIGEADPLDAFLRRRPGAG